jgi:putative membrane protein
MRRLSSTIAIRTVTLLALSLPACGGAAPATAPAQTTSGTADAPADTPGRPSIANDTFISGGSGYNAAPTMGLSPGGMGAAPTQLEQNAPASQSTATPGATYVGSLSDAQIAQFADTANSGEIEEGRFAVTHATDSKVKQFALHMVSAHTAIGQKMTAVLHKESIVPAISTRATTLSVNVKNTFDSLKSTTGSGFDKAYIDAQVTQHQSVLDMLDNELIPNAQDTRLREALQQVRLMVVEHLREAKDIQRALSSQ